MANVKLILVGGFLGAGKTTLLAKAAERLAGRGSRVGLVTNDQAGNLVDTELLRQAGRQVNEVAGACFCCAFNKLLFAADNLIALHRPDVILGEPVGSCTDLSATVLQPIKQFCPDRFDLAPYAVLIDPDRLSQTMNSLDTSDMTRAVHYIYRKQIEEADLLVVNKADLVTPARLAEIETALADLAPQVPVLTMSSLTGAGVDAWLDRVLAGGAAGQRIVEVDYDTYADGEAALGWLNAAVELSAPQPVDWKRFVLDFMHRAQAELGLVAAEIAHLKLLLTAAGGHVQANLTGNAGQPMVRGEPTAPSRYATLLINARVRIGPEELKQVVESCLRRTAGRTVAVNLAELSSFRPGRPAPTHRFSQSV